MASLSVFGVEPLVRRSPMIKGVGLAAYSLRTQMKFDQGKAGPGKLDLLDFLDICADLRLEVAELTSYYFPPEVTGEYLRELRRRAHILGLDLSSGAIGNKLTHAPGSEAAQQQQAYITKWIDHYSDLGVSVIRIFAGDPGKEISAEAAIRNAIANLGPALAHAEKRGVLLALENHDFTMDVSRLLQILNGVQSKWLGALLDSGNLRDSADPYADMAKIAPYALSAQVKVALKSAGQKTPTDYAKVVRLLNDAGYAGYLVLEYEEEEDPMVAIPRHLQSIRRALVENLPKARA